MTALGLLLIRRTTRFFCQVPDVGISGKLDASSVDVDAPSVSVPDVSGSMPEVSGDVSAPDVSGSMPEVSGDVSMPSFDASVDAPSVDASLDAPSVDVKKPKKGLFGSMFGSSKGKIEVRGVVGAPGLVHARIVRLFHARAAV